MREVTMMKSHELISGQQQQHCFYAIMSASGKALTFVLYDVVTKLQNWLAR